MFKGWTLKISCFTKCLCSFKTDVEPILPVSEGVPLPWNSLLLSRLSHGTLPPAQHTTGFSFHATPAQPTGPASCLPAANREPWYCLSRCSAPVLNWSPLCAFTSSKRRACEGLAACGNPLSSQLWIFNTTHLARRLNSSFTLRGGWRSLVSPLKSSTTSIGASVSTSWPADAIYPAMQLLKSWQESTTTSWHYSVSMHWNPVLLSLSSIWFFYPGQWLS